MSTVCCQLFLVTNHEWEGGRQGGDAPIRPSPFIPFPSRPVSNRPVPIRPDVSNDSHLALGRQSVRNAEQECTLNIYF